MTLTLPEKATFGWKLRKRPKFNTKPLLFYAFLKRFLSLKSLKWLKWVYNYFNNKGGTTENIIKIFRPLTRFSCQRAFCFYKEPKQNP